MLTPHVRLALWCEAHGLTAERTRELTLAIVREPGHTLARGLLGLVSFDGKWQRPEQVSRALNEDPDLSSRAEEYFKRRQKTPDRAEAQWKLALWCDQVGLKQQANAHLYRVLMLDHSREAAWKRLGFKKRGGPGASPSRSLPPRPRHWRSTKRTSTGKRPLRNWPTHSQARTSPGARTPQKPWRK